MTNAGDSCAGSEVSSVAGAVDGNGLAGLQDARRLRWRSLRAPLAAAALAGALAGCGAATEGSTRGHRARDAAARCPAAPAQWVRRLERTLSVPGGRLRHAVIAGPAADVDLGFPVLAGKVFVIAAELDGETKEGEGDVAAWVVGDPYGTHDAYKVIAADRNAYLYSPLGVEMYGGIEYALPEAVRARDCVLAREGRQVP